jgi:hypothetical protein
VHWQLPLQSETRTTRFFYKKIRDHLSQKKKKLTAAEEAKLQERAHRRHRSAGSERGRAAKRNRGGVGVSLMSFLPAALTMVALLLMI